jgi:hypothetical protein
MTLTDRGHAPETLHEVVGALRATAADDAVVLADGFSCRTQIHDLDSGGHEAIHLAQLLADLLHDHPQTTSSRGGSA